jgi:putative NADPH-quinone reductase
MTISLILAHPDPGSLNHALARSILEALEEAGHAVRLHDLYAERFDPVLPAEEMRTHRSDDPRVEAHVHELSEADGLIVVHPVWFDTPPAILKGWVDRVVREGDVYERTQDGGFRGLAKARAALLVTTANAPYDAQRGDALDHFWRGFVLAVAGIEPVERVHLTPVIASDLATRRGWLEEVADRAEALFPAD